MAAADEIDVREPPPLPTKKAVRKMVANKKLSRSYRNLFLKADVDSSGSLGKDEVYALLTAHGIAVSDKYLRGIFDIFDTDASGAISEQEFQCIWKLLHLRAIEGEVDPATEETAGGFERSLIDDALAESATSGNVDVEAGDATVTDRLFATGKREAVRLEMDAKFRKYDEDRTGTLSRAQVLNAFATESMHLGSAEDSQFFEDMWQAFDADKSGDIDREEFTALYRMMKMHRRKRLAEQHCGPFKMEDVHRCVIITGCILFLFSVLLLLVGMTSCDTGTPLRNVEGGTERRALQGAGAKAHALIENQEVSGIVSFQLSDGTIAISAQLQYTDSSTETTTGHPWRVHTNPSEDRVDCASSSVCSCAGARYDPTGAEGAGYVCDNSVDQTDCYRGDLEGKFGSLDVLGKIGTDAYLDLRDMVGRSIVIHAAAGAAPRIGCGTIVETVATRGGGVHALIDSAEISGRVQFKLHPEGYTDITIALRYKDGTRATTSGHSWHVHEDAAADSADCAAAGGHYDPTNKEIAPYNCDPTTPAECYAGDMSGKHGSAVVMGAVGVDSVLTMDEIVGKSVVIYGSNSETPIACGTIHGGDAHDQRRPCAPEPPPSPLDIDASLCGEHGDHHCYFGGSCIDVAPAVCQISGDPHYVSFDKARFDFMGPGYFWAVKSDTVLVQVLNLPCGNWQRTTVEAPVGCTHAVAAKIKRANGNWVEKNTAADGSFEITEGNNRLRVKVEHDGLADSITIKLPGSFYGSVLQPSLCGNFDLNAVNDVEAAVNAAYRNAPGPPPPVRPGVAPTPWKETGACISGPYRCIDEDVRWRVLEADNFFPTATTEEFPKTFGLPGDTTVYTPPANEREIFCNTWDEARPTAERCQAHPNAVESGTSYPDATTETECEAVSVQAVESCAHAGVAVEACIVDVCATGLRQFAIGNVIAGHDLAVELGVAEPSVVQENPDCTATDCPAGVCSSPDLCSSHGQCIPHPPHANEFVCACDIGWRGPRCSTPGVPTEQTGVTLHDWACDCPPGTGGAYCEQLISDPCMTSSTEEVHAEIDTTHVTGIISFTHRAAGGVEMKVQLRYTDDTASATSGHNWHVHTNGLVGSTDCAAAGGHYDPTGLEVDGYTCDSSDQTTCFLGDLSGKFGPVGIDGELRTGVDNTLTLAELLGKSIVIHAEGGMIACADIVAGRPNTCSPVGTRQCIVTDVNTFGCECLPGWGGADCSEDIDECCSSPCRENQICTDRINAYECKTPPSFSAGMEAVAVFVEDVACNTTFRGFAVAPVVIVLVCLLAFCRSTFCGAVKHVADEDEHSLWILFLIADDQRHALEVMSNEFTIDVVQKKVEAATGVPVNDQHLEFGGRRLRAGKKLTSYGVQNGSELVLKKKDGGQVVTRQGEQMNKRREIKAVKGRQQI